MIMNFRRFERTERRLLDEFYKMFLEADSFYYSTGFDIFNSLQRQTGLPKVKENEKETVSKRSTVAGSGLSEILGQSLNKSYFIWEKADERFFWNRYMLSEIIDSQVKINCKIFFGEEHSIFQLCMACSKILVLFLIFDRITSCVSGLSRLCRGVSSIKFVNLIRHLQELHRMTQK